LKISSQIIIGIEIEVNKMADFQSFLFQNMQMIGFEDELPQSTAHRQQQQNADNELPPPPNETDIEIAVESYIPKGDAKKPHGSKVSFTEIHQKTPSSTSTTNKSNLTSKISFSSVDSDINRSMRLIDKYESADNFRRNAKYSDHSSKKSLANISTITTDTFLSARNSKTEICQYKFDEFKNIEEILSDKSETDDRLTKSPADMHVKTDNHKPKYLFNFDHFDGCDDSAQYNVELQEKEKIYIDELDENESSDNLDHNRADENQETLCYVNNTTNNYNNNLSSQHDIDEHTYISLTKPNKFYEEKRNSLFESNVIESTNIELNEYASRRSPNSSMREITSPGPLIKCDFNQKNPLFVAISDSKFRHSVTSSGDEREILSPKPIQQHKSSELVKSFKYRSISPPKLVNKKAKPANYQHKSNSRLDTLNMSSESLNSLNFNYQIRSGIFQKKPPIIKSSDEEEENIKTLNDHDVDDEDEKDDRMSIHSCIIQRNKKKNTTDLDLNDETRLNEGLSENEEQDDEENSLESTVMEPFLIKFEEELLKSSKTEMIKDFTNLKREKMIKSNNLKKCLNDIKNLTNRKSKKREVDSELITESPLYDETTAPATPDLVDELRRLSKNQIPWENIDLSSGELLLNCILENSSKDKESQIECPSVYSKNGHKISQNQVKKWYKILEKLEKSVKRPSTTQSNKKLSGKEFLMNKKRQLMNKMSQKTTKKFNEITNSCNEISKKYSDISRSVSKLYANVIHDDANAKKSKSATNLKANSKETSGKTLRKNAAKDESVASRTHSDLIETQHDCTSNDLSTCSEIDSSLEAEEERMSEKCLDNKKLPTKKIRNEEHLEKSEYINEEFFKSLHKKFFETNKNASVTKLSNSNNKSNSACNNNNNGSKSNVNNTSNNINNKNNNNTTSKENTNNKGANKNKKPSSTDDKPNYPDHFYNEINDNLDRFLDLANKNNRLNKEKTKPKAEKAEQSAEKNETIKKTKRAIDDLNTSQVSANKNSKQAHSNSIFSIAAPTQDDTLLNAPMGNLKRPLISLAKLKSPERKILYKEWFTIIKKMDKDPKFDLETLVRTRGRFTEHERISYRDKLMDRNQRLRCAKSEPNFRYKFSRQVKKINLL
jgi:hypothetical protein